MVNCFFDIEADNLLTEATEEGWTGIADTCKYDTNTGRLISIPAISLNGEY